MNFIAWMIITCEVAFWIVILFGLLLRYLFHFKKLGLILLALTPVIDLLLIIITSIDLYNGATATIAHGLAAVYIGVSIAFGKSMIKWADERFQYYFIKKGTKPSKKAGIKFAKSYAKGFIRHIIAFLIGSSILLMMIYYINDSKRTDNLYGMIKIWTLILSIDMFITISYFIWPKKEKTIPRDQNSN
ncbi:hypothetical protein [Bacillus sp. 03113]|uniref:hypothetical protein n=1 Tax=Bacillus sp. 03113 TaxID=2578211 RepID=UPI001142AF0D|nr:hypothetical protein [Bacillus sp. 03113]